MTDKLTSLIRDSRRKGLMTAYEAYVRKEPGSMDRLLKLVIEFARIKVKHLEHNFKGFGTAETADDWAQEVAIKVWQRLEKFTNDPKSTPASFYSWVHKIAFNRATDAFNYLREEKTRKVSLFVDIEEGAEEGTTEEYTEENPQIHAGPSVSDIGCTIPKSVQGLDRTICNLLLTEVQDEINGEYIMRPRNQGEVAQVLGMTTEAVEIRIRRMRDRNKAAKEQEKAHAKQHRLDEEAERRNSVSLGLAKIRGTKPR